jgi:16S rRNA (guanine527-N7)-methyltransferase
VHSRAESYGAGRDQHDLVTARAVARLDITAEYAAPLLQLGGTLVAWGGRRSSDTEAAADRAAAQLGLAGVGVRRVEPFPRAQNRYLHLMSKVRKTPSRFPRRPGVAAKRPLGLFAPAPGSSDRVER